MLTVRNITPLHFFVPFAWNLMLTILFTTIALVTGQLAQDIQSVATDIETLYGVINEEDLKLQ